MDFVGLLATIDAAAGSARNALDLVKVVKGLLGGQDQEKLLALQDSVIELRENVTAAKEAVLLLKDENMQLRQRIKELEDQAVDKRQAVLKQLGKGAAAYVLPAGAEDGAGSGEEPAIWYCQPCFDDGKKAVLQFADRAFHFDTFKCPRCGGQIKVPNDVRMEVHVAPRARTELDEFF